MGKRQSIALGEWSSKLPVELQPEVVIASSYVRARQTAEIALETAGHPLRNAFVVDERLREREFGILDRLTKSGIVSRYPDQNELRKRLGKFYYRPPGVESWCDVLLRLRSFLELVTREYSQKNVMVVCHSVVMLCLRYLLERMSEEQILDIDRRHEVANCAITSYEFDSSAGFNGKLVLRTFNYVAPVAEAGEKVTRRPDVPTN